MAEITMPQLGETVTEGTITRWFKHVGDQVAENEPLFEVSTDKVDSEVPSPAAGLLSEILVQEGDTVDVGTVLARIGDAGSVPAAEPAPARALEPAPPPQVSTSPEATPAPQPASEAPSSTMVADGPSMAAPPSRQRRRLGWHRSATPTAWRRRVGRPPPAVAGGAAADRRARHRPRHDRGHRRRRSHHAARMSRPSSSGTGAAPAARRRPHARHRAPPPSWRWRRGQRDTVVPFSNIRRRTAEHMVGSKSTSAHALAAMEVDYHNVERVRLAEKDAFRTDEGVALTYLPFVSRAVVDALRDFPELNASVGHDELIVHHDVHLGYAVDLEFQGLMVPVVHNADAKRLRALAREVADLAARARSKQLGPDDISGGTFTITNVGSYGTTMTFPVINQPQIAILSTDGVKKRPVVIEQPDGSDAIAVRPTGLLALAWDHRAVDGAYAAAFLRRVKEIIETRDWRQELA